VLVLVNGNSAVSRSAGEYYSLKRGIPKRNVLTLKTQEAEEIDRQEYERAIAGPLRSELKKRGPGERVDVLALSKGMPLKIRGTKRGMAADGASVDSELAGLPMRLSGNALDGPRGNPYFGSREAFSSARFGMFLVTRLDGYAFGDVRGMIDRAMAARDSGVAVLDARGDTLESDGDLWLRKAARLLPPERVRADFTVEAVSGVRRVIAYASWGSNDRNRKTRNTRMDYLPGAIVTEYVSTDGRTFREPPLGWEITTWENRAGHFAGSPQSLTADFIRQGATGASGHVYEPYLGFTPRPDILLPAYVVEKKTLAEAFWSSIPAVSWMNIVVGDPLCRLAQ
jgi:uncharacterized protein (TIGR03790 family)